MEEDSELETELELLTTSDSETVPALTGAEPEGAVGELTGFAQTPPDAWLTPFA
jgi:hypothetical protein